MGGYIGATAVGLTTTAADVQGDITSTDTTPELILKNTSEEDTEGGREGKITFKGEQSGGEESTLAQIESAHDGTSDDQKGDLIFKTNDGSDNASPTERVRIDSAGNVGLGTNSPSFPLHVSSTSSSNAVILLESTSAAAADGPILDLYRNSASPADDDDIGIIYFSGENDAGEKLQYARMDAFIEDASDGTEDGRVTFQVVSGGSNKQFLGLRADQGGADGEVVINESQNDINFRIESNSSTNLFVADASTNRIGIGTSSPTTLLELKSTTATAGLCITADNASQSDINLGDEDDVNIQRIRSDHTDNSLQFQTNNAEAMRIQSTGRLLIGKTSGSRTSAGCELNQSGFTRFTAASDKTLELVRTGSDGELVEFFNDSAHTGSLGVNGDRTYLSVPGHGIALDASGNSLLPTTDTGGNQDNFVDIGAASARFDDVFATNGTIQTSDRNEKQDIEDLSEAELRVATAAKGLIKKYRWIDAVEKKGDDARIHVGIIAQDLQAAFKAEGLDAGRYAMFISDTWWEADRVVPAVEANEEEGIEAVAEHTVTDTFDTQEEAPEGATERTRLGVRYPELLAFIIGAM